MGIIFRQKHACVYRECVNVVFLNANAINFQVAIIFWATNLLLSNWAPALQSLCILPFVIQF